MGSASLTAKVASMLALGLLSLFFGLLPLRLSRHFDVDVHSSKPISALNCFGAGVILTTVFTHMMPEVSHFVNVNIERGLMADFGLPVAEVVVLLGFFLVYFMEELTHALVMRFHPMAAVVDAVENPNEVATKNEGTAMSEVMNSSVVVINGDLDNEAKGDVETEVRRGSDTIDDATREEVDAFQGALRGFLVVFALSLHAVFEGIAVGVTARASVVWYLCFAIAAHKYVIAFCIGMRFVASGLRVLLIVLYQATFALISPVGILIGVVLTEFNTGNNSESGVPSEEDLQSPLVIVLQGVATGTLLYVVFFEMLEKERQRATSGLFQITFVFLGFLVMMAVQLLESHPSPSSEGCELTTSFVAGLRLPINISCDDQGTLSVLRNQDILTT